jgi:putative polyhydroxyalkanoate system protein
MSHIVVERQHVLERDVVRSLAEELAESLARQYDIRYRWHDDVIVFKRTGAHGRVIVDPQRVRVELDLGFLLMAFERTIRDEIENTLDEKLNA